MLSVALVFAAVAIATGPQSHPFQLYQCPQDADNKGALLLSWGAQRVHYYFVEGTTVVIIAMVWGTNGDTKGGLLLCDSLLPSETLLF